MRAFITGHKGFIAQNLPDSLKKYEITAVQFKGQCARTPGWSTGVTLRSPSEKT